MSKNKATLSNRKPLIELQNEPVRTIADLGREQIQSMFLNEIADWLVTRGFLREKCKEKFQEIVDRITCGLHVGGIPICYLYRKVKEKRIFN